MKPDAEPPSALAAALRIAVVYAAVGALWILGSGWVLHRFVTDPATAGLLENVKGWFYVLVTAVLLGWWLHRHFRAVAIATGRLRKQEAQLRTLGDNLPDGALYQLLMPAGGSSRFTYASAGFERIFGLPTARILADPKAFRDLIHEEDRARLAAEEERCARLLTAFDLEFRQRTVRGEERWIHARATPRRLADGAVLWDGVAADVTARKQAEAALQRSENHLRAVVNTLPDLVWLKDPQGVYLACNPRFESFFGAPEAEIIGRTDYAFMDRALADFFRANDAAAVAAGGPRVNEEEVTFAADGHRELLETIKTPMFGPDGTLIGVLGIARDITARRRTELALQASEKALREAQRIAGVGSWEWDVRNDRHVWSEKIFQIYGRDPTLPPAVYPEVSQYFTPESWAQLAAAVEKGLADGIAYECDAEVVRPDGTRRWITARGEAERDAAGVLTHLRGTVQDITDRKQVEAALRESELRRAFALDAAKAGIWEWELAGGRNVWSDELWKLYGLAVNSCEPSYEAWRQTVRPEDRPQAEGILQDAVRQEGEINLEWRLNDPAGGERWLMSRGRPLRNAAGQVVRYLGVVIDITERRGAEEEARQSEERLDFALRASHTGAWSLNLPDRTATRTLIHAQIFGYATLDGEWNLERFMSHVLPEEREAVQQILRTGITARSGWSFECRIRRTDGEVRWIFVAGGFQHQGPVARVSGIIQDITDRKQAEEALRRSEERFRTLVEEAPDGIFIQTEHRFAYLNAAALRLLGATHPEQLLRMPVEERIHPDSRAQVRERIRRLNDGRLSVPQADEVFLALDGTPREVNASAVPFEFQGRHGALVFLRDITERRRLERERAAMESQLRHQQKLESIGTLASGVAHEINNPITGIMNYAQLLQDRLPGDSPLTEFTGEILHETQRVATIVRHLLTFARNERQSHSPARVIDIVEAVLSLVRTVIRRDDITLRVLVPEDLPPVKCRSQQIQQVIMNLVTNARDALNERHPGPDPDKVLNLEARLLERDGRRWIRITIEDHGTGIAPGVRERMFDPFFTTKGRDVGTGLGLAISHGIVKEHHGEWTVESEPGRWTRMHVDLPLDNGWEL